MLSGIDSLVQEAEADSSVENASTEPKIVNTYIKSFLLLCDRQIGLFSLLMQPL